MESYLTLKFFGEISQDNRVFKIFEFEIHGTKLV